MSDFIWWVMFSVHIVQLLVNFAYQAFPYSHRVTNISKVSWWNSGIAYSLGLFLFNFFFVFTLLVCTSKIVVLLTKFPCRVKRVIPSGNQATQLNLRAREARSQGSISFILTAGGASLMWREEHVCTFNRTALSIAITMHWCFYTFILAPMWDQGCSGTRVL